MASMTEDRVEVGTCDLGNVFIFHKAEKGDRSDEPFNETWMVRAGNHTVGTYTTAEAADTVARALCGDRVANAFVAGPEPEPEPTPEPEPEYAEPVREKVSRKR